MAGDWIKFQMDTPDKPEVVAMASRLGIDPDAVVGKLIRVWAWFDKHTVDGNAESVTLSFLDRITSVTGFGEQMMFVGWLQQNGSVLTMVNFGYHNGSSAKSRALSKDRQEKHRTGNAKSNDKSVTKPLLEKRREEKNIYTDAFEKFWSEYPNKTGKGGAYNSWKKIKVSDELLQSILKSINLYKQTKQVKDGFIKNPQTWLNNRCWEDEVITTTSDDDSSRFGNIFASLEVR